MVDGSDGPRDTDAKEYIHSITASHIANTGVSIFILDGGYFTGKRIWCKRMSLESALKNATGKLTWYTRSQRYEDDGSDWILNT